MTNFLFERIIMALVIVCLSSLLIGIVWRNVRDWWTDRQIRKGMRLLRRDGRL